MSGCIQLGTREEAGAGEATPTLICIETNVRTISVSRKGDLLLAVTRKSTE